MSRLWQKIDFAKDPGQLLPFCRRQIITGSVNRATGETEDLKRGL
jgi:hypothetical protein